MGDEPVAPPLDGEEEGAEGRMYIFNQNNNSQGGGPENSGYMLPAYWNPPPGQTGQPGYGHAYPPSVATAPPQFGGWGNAYPPSPSFGGNGYPPPMGSAPVGYPPVMPPSNGGLYPVIGFNPEILLPTAKSYSECPICMELLMKPIYQCPNGHVVCNVCIDKIESCGECRAPLAGIKIRNVALEQICESMEIKCPYHADGCEVVATTALLKDHVQICEFRAIPLCSTFLDMPGCTQKVTSLSAITHLVSDHHAEVFEETKFCLRLTAPHSLFESGSTQGALWRPVLVTSPSLGTDILLKFAASSPQGHLSLTGYLLGCSEESCKQYRAKFQISSGRSRLEWTGSLLSVRHHKVTDHVPNVTTFQVPLMSLKEFVKHYSSDNPDHPEHVKLKVKAAFWKLSDEDENRPYRECFTDLESGEKLYLEKRVMNGKSFYGAINNTDAITQFAPTAASIQVSENYMPTTSSLSQYPPENICTQCRRPLYGIIYQCLQCPEATYFCRHCTEVGNVHQNHLTLRISDVGLQALAAVAYECAHSDLDF